MKPQVYNEIGFWRGFSEYFKLYLCEMKLEGQALYRVIEMPLSADQPVKFQVIDKDAYLHMCIEEIIAENMLYGFSKKEVAALSSLRSKNQQDLVVDSIQFSDNANAEPVVQCTDMSRSFGMRKSPRELMMDLPLMRRFKLTDAINISYFAGKNDAR